MTSQIKGKSKSLKIWLISIGCLVIAIAYLYIFQLNLLYVSYYYIAADHFDQGDKIYMKANFINDHQNNAEELWQLVRPITATDTLNIEVDTGKMIVKTSVLNSSLKTYMISCRTAIYKDSLKKYKTASFGQFTGHHIYYAKATDNSYVLINFFSVSIDKRICVNHSERFELPANYTFADSSFYMPSWLVSNKEFIDFQKK
jgi:hypothetical protein